MTRKSNSFKVPSKTVSYLKHTLIKELYVLADQMSTAMVLAQTTHIAEGRITPRMTDILTRYQAWAVDAAKVGL